MDFSYMALDDAGRAVMHAFHKTEELECGTQKLSKMDEVAEVIKKRNERRPTPNYTLLPDELECSVAV